METLQREGLGPIVFGALLIAASVLGDAWLISEAIAEASDPVALTVAEAEAQRHPGDELASVHLIDLSFACDEAVAIGNFWYAPGRGGDGDALLLLLHGDDEGCAAAATARAGQLAEASPSAPPGRCSSSALARRKRGSAPPGSTSAAASTSARGRRSGLPAGR